MSQLGKGPLAYLPETMLMDYTLSLLRGDQICKLVQTCIYHSGCKRCKEEPPAISTQQKMMHSVQVNIHCKAGTQESLAIGPGMEAERQLFKFEKTYWSQRETNGA